uniref:Uncharacterized protein n=1 Tax=Anopheles minimus TaxID=112268 RepID=A0A182W5E7_9DIPT
MPLPTLNRRQSRQQRRRILLLPLLGTVLVLAGLASAKSLEPSTRAPLFVFDALEQLNNSKNTWQKACGNNQQGNVGIVPDATINRNTKSINMERQINLTLLDVSNWRELPGSNNNVTTWNDTSRKRQFRFLKPFVQNKSNWDRRLSVYWAHLKLVRLFHEQYSESTNINREESDALESVNEATRQLLCMVQENHGAAKRQNKQFDAVTMYKKINFNIEDASHIKIHIWYIMCRLECFLTNMRNYLQQRNVKDKDNVQDMMSCKRCPYMKNQNKPHNKKQRKPGQNHQPGQHKRTGHSNGQRRQKQQQQQQQQQKQQQKQQQQQQQQQQHQSSKKPKGRKGSRKPKVHARNRQV